MLKKACIASSAYGGLQSCSLCPPQPKCCGRTNRSKTSSSPRNFSKSFVTISSNAAHTIRCKRRKLEFEEYQKGSIRSYATVRDSQGVDFRDNMNWPCRKNSPVPFTPSPYEIFQMERSSAYSKHKFYEMVKLYHPDRSSRIAGSEAISHVEKLERYRLIVLAHEILSDPVKRKAYDSYGAGWGARSGSINRHSRGYDSKSGKPYGYGPGFDDSPFANATWEDWERWYRRSAPEYSRQAYAGTYFNPNAFAALVIMMAVLTGIAQATRAGQYAGSLGEKQLAFTEETNRFMTERAGKFDEDGVGRDSRGRVKSFLEKRDPTRYGLKEEEEESYRKHFAAGHIDPRSNVRLKPRDQNDDAPG